MANEIPPNLIDSINRGDSVLFVGAGLSFDCGLPNWNDLISPLESRVKAASSGDPLTICELYKQKFGRPALVEYIREQTDTRGKKPPDNYYQLAKLGINHWITTNYDDFIEKTFDTLGIRRLKIVCDRDLTYYRSDSVNLIRLHGDRDIEESLVITRREFNTYLDRIPGIKQTIGFLLRTKTLLFVGYSMRDPDFRQIYDQISDELKDCQRKAYAVMIDADENTVGDLAENNITVINLDSPQNVSPSKRMADFLSTLNQEVRENSDIPRLEYFLPEAESRVREDIRKTLEANDYKIEVCVEYLIYSGFLDSGQRLWQYEGWIPFENREILRKGFIRMSYNREDSNGNTWYVIVIGRRISDS